MITSPIASALPSLQRLESNTLTMTGLRRRNNQEKWMKNRNLAEQVQAKAKLRAEYIRDN